MRSLFRSRALLVTILIIAVLALGAYGVTRAIHKASAVPPPHYTAYKVSKGDVAKVVMTTGQLAPLVSVEVSTQISGLITQVMVDFNSAVKKGEVLALIDPSTYQQALAQAKANLRSTEAMTTLAKLNLDRESGLVKRSMVAQQDYDQAEATFQQTQAALLQQQAAVQSAEVDLARCTITSPIDGIVIFKAADVGKTIQASFSAPTLFAIAQDLHKMRIIAAVSEVDVWSVKAGQDVTFTVEALPGKTFHGTLKQIRNPYTPSDKQNNSGQPQASGLATFDAVIDVENPDLLLLPSLTANVSIVVEKHVAVLRVPNSALRVQIAPPGGPGPDSGGPLAAAAAPAGAAEDGTATLYRFPNGDRNATPEKVSVKVGLTDNLMTEIISGLKEGDTIVTGTTRPPYSYHGLFF